MAVSGGPNIVDDGLVLYLDAANPRSYPRTGTTWNDLSISRLSGSLLNGPIFNPANNGNILFDGSNDFVQVEYTSRFNTSQFTIDCVLQDNSPVPQLDPFKRIVAWNDGSTTTQFVLAYSSGSTGNPLGVRGFGIRRGEGVPNYFITGSGAIPNGIHHVITTFNGTTYRMYRNGVLEGNAPFFTPGIAVGTPSNTFFIGQRGNGAGYVSGSIYQVKIYNRALSVEEVLQNYNAVRSRFGI